MARFRPEVVSAPPAVVGAFDHIFTVRTGETVLLGDPSIPGSALRGSLRARHEDSSFGTELSGSCRDSVGGTEWLRVEHSVAPPREGMCPRRNTVT